MKKIISVLVIIAVLLGTVVSVSAGESPSRWAVYEVAAAYYAGLVSEEMLGDFSSPVSRGYVARLFVNLAEVITGQTTEELISEKGFSIDDDAFDDTDDPDVLSANALGIIKGTGDHRFSPDGTLKRAHVAAMINRIANLAGIDTAGYGHSFTDITDNYAWLDTELGWPCEAGIINGTGNSLFSPGNDLTLEQTIAIIYRAYTVLLDRSSYKTVCYTPAIAMDSDEPYSYFSIDGLKLSFEIPAELVQPEVINKFQYYAQTTIPLNSVKHMKVLSFGNNGEIYAVNDSFVLEEGFKDLMSSSVFSNRHMVFKTETGRSPNGYHYVVYTGEHDENHWITSYIYIQFDSRFVAALVYDGAFNRDIGLGEGDEKIIERIVNSFIAESGSFTAEHKTSQSDVITGGTESGEPANGFKRIAYVFPQDLWYPDGRKLYISADIPDSFLSDEAGESDSSVNSYYVIENDAKMNVLSIGLFYSLPAADTMPDLYHEYWSYLRTGGAQGYFTMLGINHIPDFSTGKTALGYEYAYARVTGSVIYQILIRISEFYSVAFDLRADEATLESVLDSFTCTFAEIQAD